MTEAPEKTFDLELQSPVDSQRRLVRVGARDADHAKQIALERELKMVDFSLLPPPKDVWEVGGHAAAQAGEGDGVVDLSRWDSGLRSVASPFAKSLEGEGYDEHVSAAQRRLDQWGSRVDVGPDGKVRHSDLHPHAKARLLAHHQHEPYEVVGVREVDQAEIDAQQLVALVKRLKEASDPRYDPASWDRLIDDLRAMGIDVAAVTAQVHGIAALPTDDGSTPIIWTGGSAHTIAIPLLTAYTANPDTHQFWSSVVGTEVIGTGYTANGPTLASKTSTYDTATDQTRLDGADVSLTSSTISATDCAVVDRTPGTDASRPVYGSVDFGGTVATTNGTFTITWDATGIIVRDYT